MITDRLLHIHLSRTGGFLFRYVLQNVGGLRILSGANLHLTYQEMQNQVHGDVPPAVTFIRNPWEYYVSMWGWLTLAHRDGFPPAPFSAYMDRVKEGSKTNRPYMTLTHNWKLMGCEQADYIGRFERLKPEIIRILDEIIPDLISPEQTAALLLQAPPFHISPMPGWRYLLDRPRPYHEYYDSELKEQVQEWDGEMIERFGYTF